MGILDRTIGGVKLRIREIREAQKATQLQIAVKAGITPTALARIEAGKAVPKLNHAKAIADALGVKVDDLIAE